MKYRDYRFFPWQLAVSRWMVNPTTGYNAFACTSQAGSEPRSAGTDLVAGVGLDGLMLPNLTSRFAFYVPNLLNVSLQDDIEVTLDIFIDDNVLLNETLYIGWAYSQIIKGHGGTTIPTAIFATSTEILQVDDVDTYRKRIFTIGGMTIPAGTLGTQGAALILHFKSPNGNLYPRVRVLGMGLTFTADVPWS